MSPEIRMDPFASASRMLDLLNRRAISACELLEFVLGRIERFDGALNAIVTRDFERARLSARKADQRRSDGLDALLLGLPITVKDCIDVEGLRGTAGALEFADRCPSVDAPAVVRLLRAGAVIIGKTNVPPWASDFQASNPIFGRTNNPWDLRRTPGGSTGGGAVALAAGLTYLELGSDIAGSIRVPAAFCGIYGLKPSETAVPHSGHFPGSPPPNAAAALEVMGPLARDAGDLEVALDVIGGPEVGEDTAWRLEIPPARHRQLRAFRVAFLPPLPWVPLDDEIRASHEELGRRLESRCARLGWAGPPLFGDGQEHHRLYSSLLGVMAAWGQSLTALQQHAQEVQESDEFDRAYAHGFEATGCEYLRWHQRREEFRQAWRDFYREWDVLIAPSAIVPAFKHKDPDESDPSFRVNHRPVNYNLQTVYPGIASLAGQPAVAFPVGLSRSGVPIGLQAIGPYLEDRTPIRFVQLLAEEFGGFKAPPGWE